MKSSIKRLAKDQVGLRRALPPNYLFEDIEAGQCLPDDLTQLVIYLAGPEGTPYAQGLWQLRLDIPLEYPQSPPTATFKTRIFHPNVAEETGAVCLETLKRDWDPKFTLKDILITISCLLIHPNPDSALNQKAGALIQDDYDAFARQAKLMTRIHAPTPANLMTAADEARRRGEENDPTDPKTKSNISTKDSVAHKENRSDTAADCKPVSPRPAKRPLDQQHLSADSSQDVKNAEERRRKSPKHEAHQSACTVDEPKANVNQDTGSEDSSLPKKVVFTAHWSLSSLKGPRTKARIGIRRL